MMQFVLVRFGVVWSGTTLCGVYLSNKVSF